MAPVAPIPGHITVLYIFAVFNLILLCHMTFVDADVYVLNQRNYTVWDAQDKEARFGDRVPDIGFRGFLQRTEPRNACSEVVPPPPNDTYPWVALVERYGCDFSEKVYHAQQAGYAAAIVYNLQSSDLVDMGGGKEGQLVTIPSVFVGYEDGVEIGRLCESHQRSYTVLIYPQAHPLPIKEMLIPFIICVGICCLIMIGVLVGKWFRDWRKRRKARLSKQHLKKLPTKKFKKGDEYDCCAICLDDYEEGDKLRILPCQHAYHMKCVDPWLLNNKRVCPVCKRKVIPGDETDSESDSDDDDGATERTPLLSSQADGHSVVPPRSTFDNSGLPENARREAYVPIDDSDEEHPPTPASRSMQSYVEVHGGPSQSRTPSAAQPERQSRFPTLASLVRSTRRNRQDRRAPAEGTPARGEVVNEQPSRRKKKSKRSREAGGVGPQGSINEGDEGRLYVEQEEEEPQGAVGGGPLSSYQGVSHPLMDLVEDHFARDNKAEASNPDSGDLDGLQDETRPLHRRPPSTEEYPQDSEVLPEVAVASGSRGKKKRKRKRKDDNDQA